MMSAVSTDTDVYNPRSQPQLLPDSASLSPQFPVHDPHRTCSVRGCNQPLLPEATTKMCEACRGRHRIYATTKRARRKLEKAAVVGMKRIGAEQLESTPSPTAVTHSPTNVNPGSPMQTGWTLTSSSSTQPWDTNTIAIDPQLFAEPAPAASTVSMHHPLLPPPFPGPSYLSSSSSELAGALTLPPAEANNSSYYRSHVVKQKDDGPEAEEHEVAQSLQASDTNAVDRGSADPETSTADVTLDGETGPLRPCSVKGCKAMIPSSYTFKMCPPCRTRYRTYGNTKRAKWKAEREAFDRELLGLRSKEDERRKVAGERPLSESPDDLRAWELSIIDEEISATGGDPADMEGSGDDMMMDPAESSQIDSNGTATSPLPSAARMCTVSHCHKILPGFYRYKRCEQHRLQNRYHSQLKRVRERSEKAAMVQDSDSTTFVVLEGGGGAEEGEGSFSGERETKKEQGEGSLSGEADKNGEDKDDDKDEKPHPRKRHTTCVTASCHNLLAPGVRWRHCEVCRARDRVFRREKKEQEEGAAKEVERLREIVRMMEAGVIPSGAGLGLADSEVGVGVGMGGEQGQAEAEAEAEAAEGGAADAAEAAVTAPVGGGDATPVPTSSESATAINANAANTPEPADAATPSAPAVPPPAVSHILTSYPHTFQSVFRANVRPDADPATADSSTSVNTSVSMNSVVTSNMDTSTSTMASANGNANANTELTIREYKPKGAGKPPELSKNAQVFRGLVQRDQQTSSGLVGPSSYHVYKSTPPPASASGYAPAPTAPASAPALHHLPGVASGYEPPPKKQKTQPVNEAGGAQKQNQAQAPADSSKSLLANTATTATRTSQAPTQTSAPPPSSPPSGPVIPRQRKPRASRAKPKSPPPPTPTPAPAPHTTHSPYPYMSPSQYPYPYYISPYAYGMHPRPPSTSASASSSSTPYPSSSTHYPTPYTYPYPYSYPPPGAPPPGYAYMSPPRYPPGAYPQHAYQQGAYAAPYGYASASAPAKDARPFSYYKPLDAEKKRKRKREEEEACASASASAPPAAHPMSVVAQPYLLRPVQSSEPTPVVAAATPMPVVPTPTPVNNAGNTSASVAETGKDKAEAAPSSPPAARACANKTCHRTTPADGGGGTLCEKCRGRIKRHLAKARQRYKLEPRKSVVMPMGRKGSRKAEGAEGVVAA